MSKSAPQVVVATAGSTGSFEVTTLAGQPLSLQTAEEQRLYRSAQAKYTSEFKFSIASDLRALDRLIFFEILLFRWQAQLASGRDYDGNFLGPAGEDALRRNIKDTAPLVSSIQNDLGLNKAARDRESVDSVGAYITRLQQAAKEHGIRREKQLGRALELVNELFSLVGTYRRSNETERRKIGLTSAEDILDWVETYMRPEYDIIDEHFRSHSQRMWVRTL